MLLFYRILVALVLLIIWPYLIIKAIWGKHGVSERLGFVPKRQGNARLFWFHAASVGELKVLSTVIPEMKKLLPEIEVVVSTTTATGRRRAKELFGNSAIIVYQPLEITSAILRSIENLRPEKLISVETEIWPLWLIIASEMGVELNLINACMSKRSFRLYRIFRPFTKKILGKFTRILAQSETDAKRFAFLGAPNIEVIGNIKFDQAIGLSKNIMAVPEIAFKDYLTLTAGSLRRGEENDIFDTISRSRKESMKIFYVIVPRHMKDIDHFSRKLAEKEIPYILWSETRHKKIDPNTVLLVDTMGELGRFYKSADLTFVGGSLVPIGGHDPVEPAALGKPVIFGPHMENAQLAANILVGSGGANVMHSSDELYLLLCVALNDRSLVVDMGEHSREAVLSMTGVSAKTARIIAGDRPR